MDRRNQRSRILEYMRSHNGKITTAEAADNLRILSFTKRISELRRKGYLISDEVVIKYRTDGSFVRFKVYKLEEEGEAFAGS